MKFVGEKGDEVSILFNKLKYHSEQGYLLDTKLAKICREEIKEYIEAGNFLAAKEFIRNFYKGYENFSVERDLLLSHVNRLVREASREA